MDRLGLVTAPRGRTWRAYAGPAALLLAATAAIGLLRGGLRHHSHPAASTSPAVHMSARHTHAARRAYVVRAGDTIAAIAASTGVSQARILALNPHVSPTALFIGEKLHLG